eukprot:IDg4595t1
MKQTIVAHLEAPRLKGTTTKDINSFLRTRELYEKQIEEKNGQPGVKADTIADITEEELKACIKARASRKPKDHELGRVENIVACVKMDPTLVLLEDRVCHLVQQYMQVLENAGMSTLPDDKPHLAIKHIMKRLKPACLYKCMQDIIEWRKDEQFDRKDFKVFVQELSKQAMRMDEDGVGGRRLADAIAADGADEQDDDADRDRNGKSSRRGRRNRKGGRNTGGSNDGEQKPSSDSNAGKSKRDKSSLPICLNQKERLLKEYRLKMKKRKERFDSGSASNYRSKRGGIAAVKTPADRDGNPSPTDQENTALFSASFCNGGVECEVLTDQGSDVNLVPPEISDLIISSHPDLKTRAVDPPAKYNSVAIGGVVICDRSFKTDIKLRIRHGTTLILRSVEWLVGDKSDNHAIIGRPLLDALGCSNKDMLSAAADRNAGVFDANSIPNGRDGSNGAIAALLGEHDGVYHSAAGVDDTTEADEHVYIDIGDDDEGEVDYELEQRLAEAIRRGQSQRGAERLLKILKDFRSVFRIRLGKTPPASVPPMKIDLDPSKTPVQVRARRYSAPQRAFLNEYVKKLEEMGFFIANPNAEWQAAPHIVPKPSSRAKFRMTIDLRPVNAATRKRSRPMPHLDSEMQDFRGSKCFLGLDFVSGYWQIPLHPDSFGACGVVTPNGSYSSTRVLQGLTNAAAYFQSNIEPLFSELRENLKAWLDDFNLHARDENTLLSKFERFLEIWCGRIVAGDGYTMDPAKTEALRDMHKPINAGELCEFVHCMRWMALAIPQFSERVAPLQAVLEAAYAKAGRRTKRAIKNIPLASLSWGTAHDATFVDLQDSLRNAVKLSYPHPGKAICVHTDASDRYWSGVVSQVVPSELTKTSCDQSHEPLGFVGGEFTKAELNWSTFEKEGFAIFKTFEKLDYLLLGEQPVHVFTDHRNLLYVFAPCALVPTSPRHVVSKVQRWAMYLSRFDYAIEHIDGTANIFADLLTRWGRGHRVQITSKPRICNLTLATEQLVPAADEVVWPTRDTLISAQQRAAAAPARGVADADGLILQAEGSGFPPTTRTRSFESSSPPIAEAWDTAEGQRQQAWSRRSSPGTAFYRTARPLLTAAFTALSHAPGTLSPQPHSHALHGEQPNEVVHADYLYMGPSATTDLKYVLIIRDDLSSYVWLWPTAGPTSESAAEAFATWIAAFESFKWLVTDQGTHFASSLVRELVSEICAQHHFTTAYCPWANGTVERVCQEVLRTTTALLMEIKLAPMDWLSVLDCVQSVLNQSPLRRLGPRTGGPPGVHRSPLEVFTGMQPTRPLLRALPLGEFNHCPTLDEVRARQVMRIDAVQDALDDMHRDVLGRVDARRKRSITDHNRRTGVQPVNFGRGDFVLVRRAVDRGHKLSYRWTGPRRVLTEVSPLVFEVEDLLTKRVERAHARRLMLYRADMDGVAVDQRLADMAEHSAM